MVIAKIVSGGQTGVDRGALEAAVELGFPYGGLVPKGRRAEDGVVPETFDQMTEAPFESYVYRTEQNVVNSDCTLIISREIEKFKPPEKQLSGGTYKTYLLLLCGVVAWTAEGAVECRFYPTSTNGAIEVVAHQDYALGYCEDWEMPAWVVERLSPSMFAPNYDRSSGFRSDPKVSTGSAVSSDYTNSGYDRGHMAPAADFSYDETAMYESFYMSNIAPQVPNLNRGVWASLEEWVRTAASRERSLLVVTGPVVTGEVARIGKNGVAVPQGFYKALCDLTPPQKMIGFLYANREGEPKDIAGHAVSIDALEALTGLDLFAALSNDTQEASCDFSAWEKPPERANGFLILVK